MTGQTPITLGGLYETSVATSSCSDAVLEAAGEVLMGLPAGPSGRLELMGMLPDGIDIELFLRR